MNDYLSNLVGKALNRLPVVRPRPAPLFAPSPYVAGAFGSSPSPSLAPDKGDDDETLTDTQSDARGPQETTSALRREMSERAIYGARQHERRGTTPVEGLETRAVETRGDRPAEAADAPYTSAALTPRGTQEPPIHPGALTPLGEERDVVDASTTRPSLLDDADERRARLETDRRDESLTAGSAAARATEAALSDLRRRVSLDEKGADQLAQELARARTSIRGLSERASSRRDVSAEAFEAGEGTAGGARRRPGPRDESSAAPTPTVQPRSVTPAPQTRPTPAEFTPRLNAAERVEPGPPVPTPTIQVTIGRIEVRATQQPAPQRKTAAPAPRLSLEEYLQQRSGGSR